MLDERRIRNLNTAPAGTGPVVYLMQRDQRAQDNWALLHAQEQALKNKVPLIVVFSVFTIPSRATERIYDFMLTGLKEVEETLAKLQIPFVVLEGKAEDMVPSFVKKIDGGELVLDFNPLRRVKEQHSTLAKKLPMRVSEVDSHNIVPCWQASPKEEFAAYTFRPKINRLLSDFLTDIPTLKKHPYTIEVKLKNNWQLLPDNLKLEPSQESKYKTGETLAKKRLREFIETRLPSYHLDRNDPNKDGQSGISPYLHFGQLSAQRVALEVKAARAPKDAKDAFLEELIVRKELADNYCFYNEHYDKVAGAHAWAQKTIEEHKNDSREHLYTKEQFERGDTHDELWNAMQQQMVEEGKMHGWCRMYWAKKILEWTPDVQTAIDIALYLNDKYELDGGDPNGICGVMWSICGVHDRAWNEREIFGKIRYMNFAGAKRKFDVKAYIERYGKDKTLFD